MVVRADRPKRYLVSTPTGPAGADQWPLAATGRAVEARGAVFVLHCAREGVGPMRKHGNGTVVGWRGRHNPLRRPNDAREARIVPAAWTLTAVGGAALGAAAGYVVDATIEHDAAGRTPVAAVMTGTDPALRGIRLDHVSAKVHRTDATGTVRGATTEVKAGAGAVAPPRNVDATGGRARGTSAPRAFAARRDAARTRAGEEDGRSRHRHR